LKTGDALRGARDRIAKIGVRAFHAAGHVRTQRTTQHRGCTLKAIRAGFDMGAHASVIVPRPFRDDVDHTCHCI
jgi:hypothetical protein